MLDDGTYDTLVVDATVDDDGTVGVELTVVAGPAKGALVTVRSRGLTADPLDLLGVPATLTVTDGHPDLRLEP